MASREHRGFADPGRSLDYEDAALILQRPLQVPPDLLELSIAFKQQAIIRAHPQHLRRTKLTRARTGQCLSTSTNPAFRLRTGERVAIPVGDGGADLVR